MFTDGNRKETYPREFKFHVTRKEIGKSVLSFMKHLHAYPYPEKVPQHIESLTMPKN